MQFESDSFYEIAKVIRTADYVRVRFSCGASDRYRPAVCVVRMGVFAFFGGQHCCRVSIDDRTVYCQSLAFTVRALRRRLSS